MAASACTTSSCTASRRSLSHTRRKNTPPSADCSSAPSRSIACTSAVLMTFSMRS
ncbi:hypothetical protein ACFPRL_27200 [Pseudoclavibacter helvolus]